jgi:SPP1 family predicted phage head-tail adaptor
MNARWQAGQLRVLATLEAPNDIADGAGGYVRSYAALARVWARITPLHGEARFLEQRQEQAVTHLARIRWRANVTGGMRFSIGTRRLLIHAVYDEDERRRFLLCRCEEIAV